MDGTLLAAGIVQLLADSPLSRQGTQMAFWAATHAIILIPFSSSVQVIHPSWTFATFTPRESELEGAAYCSAVSFYHVVAVALLPWINFRFLIKLGLPPVTALLAPIPSWQNPPTAQLVSEPGTLIFNSRIFFGPRTRSVSSPFLSAVFSTLLIIGAWALFYISIMYLALTSTLFLQPHHLFTLAIPHGEQHQRGRIACWHAYPVLLTGATPIVLFMIKVMSCVVVKITSWY